MKASVIVGIILIVAATATFIYQGVSYTTEEQLVDIGPLEVTEQDTETIPIPPLVSALGLVAGIGLVWLGSRGARQ